MTPRSKLITTGLILGTSLSMLACSSDEANSNDNYKVALVLPYSEEFASRGKEYENAMSLAVEDLYAAGFKEASGGRGFEFTVISSGNGVDAVRERLQTEFDSNKLAEGGVNYTAVISSTGAAQVGSTEIAGRHSVPHFETSFGAHYEEFLPHEHFGTEVESYLFSTRALCLPEAIVTADFIHAQYPGKKIALLRGTDTHDIMHTTMIRDRLAYLGFTGEVLVSDHQAPVDPTFGENRGDYMLSYEKGTFDTELQALIDTEQPDVMFFHLGGDSFNLRFLQDAKRVDFQGDIVTCGMFRVPTILDGELNGGISEYIEDRLYFVMRAPIPSSELSEFNTRYEQKFPGFKASTFASANYDAMVLVGLAALQAYPAKSGASIRDAITDVSADGTKYGYKNLSNLVSDIKAGKDVDYDGPSGNMDIDENRTVPGSYYVEIVESNGSNGLKYTELIDPIGRVIRSWDEE